ncbi:hypothetical protein PDJ95_01775 [Bacillus cereus]|nr:hypothetical protein [Bacillus cereus]HDR6269333.1 hypothetical protein [Bacillus cereus]
MIIILEINYQKKSLQIKSIWFFEETTTDIRKSDSDIVYFHQSGIKSKFICEKFTTLISDLENDEEELFRKITKNGRNEINKSIREEIQFEVLDNNQLDEFIQFYNEFALTKGLAPCNEITLHAYAQKDALVITKAKFQGNDLVYHAYLMDESRTRLLYSASAFRNTEDKKERAMIGRANRFLHWKDILMFKEKGMKIYDWGGYSEAEEVRAIAKFKAGFGGEIEYSYNSLLPVTLKGKLVCTMLKIKKMIKN